MLESGMKLFRLIMMALAYAWLAIPAGTILYGINILFFIIKLTTGIDFNESQQYKDFW